MTHDNLSWARQIYPSWCFWPFCVLYNCDTSIEYVKHWHFANVQSVEPKIYYKFSEKTRTMVLLTCLCSRSFCALANNSSFVSFRLAPPIDWAGLLRKSPSKNPFIFAQKYKELLCKKTADSMFISRSKNNPISILTWLCTFVEGL